MSRYRAHLRDCDALLGLALTEARRLHLLAIGPGVIVLALLHPDAPSPSAAEVLVDCGLDRLTLERAVAHYHGDRAPEHGPQLNPAGHQLFATAEGIAAGLGAERVTGEHLLLAYIWDPGHFSEVREPTPATRQQLRERLAGRGYGLPHRELPAADPRHYGPPLDVSDEELRIALTHLDEVLPDGASMAFNTAHDGRSAFICIDEGLDAEHYLRLAVQRSAQASG